MDTTLPLIFGISSTKLTEKEIDFFAKNKIWGIIIFARNISDAEQLKSLIVEIKKILPEINILIDEEGGRVTRLNTIYERLPSSHLLGLEYIKNKEQGTKKIKENYKIIAERLKSLGINIACSPVCDINFPDANDIIGDRAFGDSVDIISECAKIAADTLLEHDITPIIKHIPGHGRALLDSHLDLPIVTASLEELEKTDFKIFKNLNSYPLAMTAHITYTALDKEYPVTISKKSISYIKNDIAFAGKIMSDDLAMHALNGFSLEEIVSLSLDAGVDYLLHCNGEYEEMIKITKECKRFLNL